jgi:beta-N-acetylhexosaminidase
MEALKGSLGERAANAVRAGCDILLHCNGKMDEARAVAREAPLLDGRSAERAARALSLIAGNAPVAKEPAARERFAALMAAA